MQHRGVQQQTAPHGVRALALGALLLLAPTFTRANAQRDTTPARTDTVLAARDTSALQIDSVVRRVGVPVSEMSLLKFRTRRDSMAFVRTHRSAMHDAGLRVVVSLIDKELLVMSGEDTVRVVPAAVASGMTLAYGGHSWTFRTPRGKHTVLRKTTDPVWTPPDWAYAEVAHENGLYLGRVPASGSVKLKDGRKLTVRGGLAGLVLPDGSFATLPTDEHIVFDKTLYVPPLGSKNRRVHGELGHFALDLGDGYMIHGTPDQASIGRAATHGCIRLKDDDIEWLYENVPLGTPVYIY